MDMIFKIDTNRDELLETIWEIWEKQKGGENIIKFINLHLRHHYSYLSLSHIFKVKLQLKI
jgi:mannosyltransferase OCH1-like enzyme